MKLFISTPFIGDADGGMPKVVLPLFSGLKNELGGSCVSLVHSDNLKSLSDFRSNLTDGRGGAQLVHDHGAWLPFHLKIFLLSKLFGLTVVLSPHGTLDRWAMSHKGWKKKIAWNLYQKYTFKFADAIVVNSSLEFDRVRELGFRNRVAIIENGVELPALEKTTILSSKGCARKALFFSRINPIKGIVELIEAWSKSKALREYNYILNIYGNCDDEKYLETIISRIKKLRLESSVFIKGPVYGIDKWRIYESHDFLILPSYSENFGIVVPEALYSGIPVITTDGAPWRHLEGMGFGVTVKHGDDSLIRAIDDYASRISDNDGFTADFRNAARQYVIANYSWPIIVKKYLLFYSWLVSEGSVERPDFVSEL